MLIDYNMTRDYCKDWTAIDAIREMVQNAIDLPGEYEVGINADRIYVTSYGTALPASAFALGESRKAANSIGGYGEGFKIGMLVLTRLGLLPRIETAGFMASGNFSNNAFTGLDTFKIQISELGCNIAKVHFSCKNEGIDIDELKAKLTHFSDNPLPKLQSRICTLQDRPGMLFVNGLFVCEQPKLTFGYNFSPDKIKLNRDRNMVDGAEWQLAYHYASMKKEQAELIFNLVETDAEDVAYLGYVTLNRELAAKLACLFYVKYGEGATMSKPGSTYVGSSSFGTVSSNSARVYGSCGIKETKQAADPEAPCEILKQFIKANKRHLRRDIRKKAERLVNQSKGWSKGKIY